jgi:hypothetical protein
MQVNLNMIDTIGSGIKRIFTIQKRRFSRCRIIQLTILDKLPDILSDIQKKNKIRNVLQTLKDKGLIEIDKGKSWKLKNV